MARNKQALRRTAQATADGYENFIARVGMQTPNQHSASTYRANFTSRNRMLVEWSYRSSWIIGEAVDAIPDDMTRKGIRITSEIDAKDRGILESQLDELQIWDALNDVLKWSRLYGGAVGFIMIEGQAPMTPLRPETIGKGKFKGILPLDRWMIDPVLTRRIKDMGPDLGKPEFYDVVTTATGIPAWRIHHSRLIRFDGVTLPFQQKMTENEWGMSVVERIWDRLTAFDSATVGAAQLVYKAHLRTYSVEKLRELIALGGPAYEALLKNIDLIRQFQSNEGMTLMDSRDKFETHQYSFSGLDDILSQFAEQISGAVGIPLVRLFGQSPKGFSTGDADLANYYDRVPPHSVAVIVDGGDVTDIAQAIRGNKGQGTATHGTTSVTVPDKYGNPHVIKFSRSSDVPVYARIKLKVFTGYTSQIGQQIQQAISDYINSLMIGDSVLLSRIYSPANLGVVSGGNARYYDIQELTIGKSPGALSSSNIDIRYNESASCTPENIVITVES
ncbi:TPA: phage portal protein [Escherichia coli]